MKKSNYNFIDQLKRDVLIIIFYLQCLINFMLSKRREIIQIHAAIMWILQTLQPLKSVHDFCVRVWGTIHNKDTYTLARLLFVGLHKRNLENEINKAFNYTSALIEGSFFYFAMHSV